MQKLQLLFFALSLTVWSHAQPVDGNLSTPSVTKWGRLSDSTYSVRFPGDWSVDQSGQFGTRFFLYAPFDSIDDAFRENFNLVINDINRYPYATVEFMADGARQQVARMISDFKEQEYRIVHNGADSYYVFEYSGKQGTFDLHWKQIYVLEKGKFYVLTFTAEANQYLKYLPIAERIFSSFTLK
jgi:eukaryotic-like serine/threonine-protein kinase